MHLKYHPITAFLLVYLTGVVLLGSIFAGLAMFAKPLWAQIHASGFLIFLPFMLSFFATQQSFKGNGPPFVHFEGVNPETLKGRFRTRHLSWAIVFGCLATLITLAVALALWALGSNGNPFGNVFMIVVALVINLVSCFQGIKYGLTPPKAFDPGSDAVEANPAAMTAWAVRRMRKNMNKGAADTEVRPENS